MVKIRYTKTSMTSRSLHRVLTSDRVAKYATIGKFLGVAPVASTTNQSPVSMPVVATTPVISSASVPPSSDNPILELDPNLELLDGLVAETLANKSSTLQVAATPQVAVSTRAKEVVSATGQDLLAQAESVTEATTDLQETGAEANVEAAPTIESQEVQELTKELQEVSKETKEQREQALIQEKQRAINDLAAASTTPVAITDKPVIVLPITAKSREEAKFKSTKYSVKWLWEWSQKIIKMFAGAVVYKEEVEEA